MLKNVTFLGMFPSLKDSGHRLAFSDLTFFIFTFGWSVLQTHTTLAHEHS